MQKTRKMFTSVVQSDAKKSTTTINTSAKPVTFFQPKLTINTSNNAHEQEADRVADQVIRMGEGDASVVRRMPLTPVGGVQRKCAECEKEVQRKEKDGMEEKEMPVQRAPTAGAMEEEKGQVQRKCANCEKEEKKKVQRKEGGSGDAGGQAAPSVVSDVLSAGGGQQMDDGTRQFMESRFGQDFSQVRIHTGERAAESASAIQARAYTSGRDVVFGRGEYQPESEGGRRLLAHELVHVGQQGGGIKRATKLATTASHCTPGTDGVPTDFQQKLQTAHTNAILHLTTASFALSLANSMAGLVPPNPTVRGAYLSRFGAPTSVLSPSSTKFRDRFHNRLLNTLVEAETAEMAFLGDRLLSHATFLFRNITFRCTGGAAVTHGNCTTSCSPTAMLISCPQSNHGNTILVCSGFWGLSADQQAIGIIHEVGHMRLLLGDHDKAPFADTFAKRRNEPECYASLVADIVGSTPFDPSCPALP